MKCNKDKIVEKNKRRMRHGEACPNAYVIGASK